MSGNLPLARRIAVVVSKRGNELQHLSLALGKLSYRFYSTGSHMTTILDLIGPVKGSEYFLKKNGDLDISRVAVWMAVYVSVGTIFL